MKTLQYGLDRDEVLELRQGPTVEARRLGSPHWVGTMTPTLKDAAKGLLLCRTVADALERLGTDRPTLGLAVQFQSVHTLKVSFADWASKDTPDTLITTTAPELVAYWPTWDAAALWLEGVGLLNLDAVPVIGFSHLLTTIVPCCLERLEGMGTLLEGTCFELKPGTVRKQREKLSRRLEEGRRTLEALPMSPSPYAPPPAEVMITNAHASRFGPAPDSTKPAGWLF